ncbi:type I pantothenate kinase [Parvibaculum sp.]|jgi:type I pantothenate kinase|uniref:type I pantothenate kinase n=1 Tax=Parvibaculum sp. TaxID=2024848 RepID=UPI0025FE0833|nr:type I pantothenate kinase [Parvibaculum sp.]|tara:strand:- start:26526 stop:27494 length:969 start_codon:yes stop_codon:yes gene_type:complete
MGATGMIDTGERESLSPFRHFTAADWGRLREDTPLPLSEAELEELKGFGERISLDEVSEIFLPLSRLLNLYIGEMQELYRVTSDFLGRADKVPYIVGVAGSVAVGKSTTARILRALLARWPNHPKVDLITTDGFLYPNKLLEERGLMQRKGFPESFDIKRLIRFLSDVKAGSPRVEAPVYSHFTYDVLPGETVTVDQPDILVVEGLNVLQPWKPADGDEPQPFVSDFFDFSIYLDADEEAIRRWYIERFLSLRRTSFKDPAAYFHRYSKLTEKEAIETADAIWTSINLANLHKNILPTRQRADLILRKGDDHRIRDVYLRKI